MTPQQAFNIGFEKRAAEYGIEKSATLRNYINALEEHHPHLKGKITKNHTFSELKAMGVGDTSIANAQWSYGDTLSGRKVPKDSKTAKPAPSTTVAEHWGKIKHRYKEFDPKSMDQLFKVVDVK